MHYDTRRFTCMCILRIHQNALLNLNSLAMPDDLCDGIIKHLQNSTRPVSVLSACTYIHIYTYTYICTHMHIATVRCNAHLRYTWMSYTWLSLADEIVLPRSLMKWGCLLFQDYTQPIKRACGLNLNAPFHWSWVIRVEWYQHYSTEVHGLCHIERVVESHRHMPVGPNGKDWCGLVEFESGRIVSDQIGNGPKRHD